MLLERIDDIHETESTNPNIMCDRQLYLTLELVHRDHTL